MHSRESGLAFERRRPHHLDEVDFIKAGWMWFRSTVFADLKASDYLPQLPLFGMQLPHPDCGCALEFAGTRNSTVSFVMSPLHSSAEDY